MGLTGVEDGPLGPWWQTRDRLILDGMDDSTLLDEIRLLLDAKPAPAPERVEHTLTDGYARALALEAEQWRLRRRIGELAARSAPDPVERSRELSSLSEQLGAAEAHLARLRAVLSLLRARTGATRGRVLGASA